jgi:hypothetical protein
MNLSSTQTLPNKYTIYISFSKSRIVNLKRK